MFTFFFNCKMNNYPFGYTFHLPICNLVINFLIEISLTRNTNKAITIFNYLAKFTSLKKLKTVYFFYYLLLKFNCKIDDKLNLGRRFFSLLQQFF